MTKRKSIFPLQPTGFPSPRSWPEPTSQISVVDPTALLVDVLARSPVVELVLLVLASTPLVLPVLAPVLAAGFRCHGCVWRGRRLQWSTSFLGLAHIRRRPG